MKKEVLRKILKIIGIIVEGFIGFYILLIVLGAILGFTFNAFRVFTTMLVDLHSIPLDLLC